MIPVDIVVLAIFAWLGVKLWRWWSRARSLEKENAKLRAENEQMKADLGVFVDDDAKVRRK